MGLSRAVQNPKKGRTKRRQEQKGVGSVDMQSNHLEESKWACA